jgi:MFS family permease
MRGSVLARSIVPVLALLAGTAFLLAANGLHGLLLPLRGGMEGFSTTSLGLLGTAWAGGFVAGCLIAPRLVMRVGHVRAFGAFAASASAVALLTGLFVEPTAWIALRVFTGFAMSGAFMVIESWLNERSTNETRGQVFSLYMMVTFLSITAGQMIVASGDLHGQGLFMVAGIFYCLALLPTSLSTAVSPKPLHEVRIDLKGLYANSPVAFVGCLLVGVANGCFGTLGAVYGARIGIGTPLVAAMMSVTVLAGALMQIPVGRLSDRTDRRYVMALVAGGAAIVGLVILGAAPREPRFILLLTGIYGGLAYTLYAIAVAHANDFAGDSDFVKISSGLLLLYGFGTMVGPLLGAAAMETIGPGGLFLVTAVAHGLTATHAVLRSFVRPPVPVAKRGLFQTVAAERAVTPEGLKLDPRADADKS